MNVVIFSGRPAEDCRGEGYSGLRIDLQSASCPAVFVTVCESHKASAAFITFSIHSAFTFMSRLCAWEAAGTWFTASKRCSETTSVGRSLLPRRILCFSLWRPSFRIQSSAWQHECDGKGEGLCTEQAVLPQLRRSTRPLHVPFMLMLEVEVSRFLRFLIYSLNVKVILTPVRCNRRAPHALVDRHLLPVEQLSSRSFASAVSALLLGSCCVLDESRRGFVRELIVRFSNLPASRSSTWTCHALRHYTQQHPAGWCAL